MRSKNHILFIICALLAFGSVKAQAVKFRSIGTEQGLSVGFVQCVIQDHKGFMWFGTQDGLNKYDGYEMAIFRNNPKEKNCISNNDIFCIYEDNKRTLWIGTNGGGLEEYDPVLNKFTHHQNKKGDKNSLGNNTVRCIYQDEQGVIWVGTDLGLSKYEPKTGKFTNYEYTENCSNCLSANIVYTVTSTSNGLLWIGTQDGGLNSFDTKSGKFKSYTIPSQLMYSGKQEYLNQYRMRIISLYPKGDGTMLVGTDGGGLGIFDINAQVFKNFTTFYSSGSNEVVAENNRIWSIAKDSKNEFWIAAYGGGLIQYNSNTGKYVMHQNRKNDPTSLNSNDIYKVFIDKQDNVWTGTQNGGVNIYFRYSAKFKHYETSENSELVLANKLVFAIMQDRDGLVWLGTDGGGVQTLDLKNKKVGDRNDLLKGVANKSILSLIQDKEGDIWIGTWGSGLYHYIAQTGKVEAMLDDDPIYATIVSLYQDSEGDVWIGTYNGGLFRYKKKTGINNSESNNRNTYFYCPL